MIGITCSKRIVGVCLLALLVTFAGCGGGGGGGGGNGETTAAETTAEETTIVGNETTMASNETTTVGNETTMAGNGTEDGAANGTSDLLFNTSVNVSTNGSVYGPDDEFLGNVSIVDDNQQGGDGFFDVNIYENGTVVDQQGEVVGQVEVNEVCPTPSQNGEFYFNGDSVDVSGAQGDVFFDNQDDTFVDLNIIEDNQGQQNGFENVRIATNGSVINEQGDVVGQVEVNQNCPAATTQN